MAEKHHKKSGEDYWLELLRLMTARDLLRGQLEERLRKKPHFFRVFIVLDRLPNSFGTSVITLIGLLAAPKNTGEIPNIDLTGGIVEFLLRMVMSHDDLGDQLLSLEEAYTIDALHFGSKHLWWGIFAARFHLYWWSFKTFAKKGVEMSPAGKLIQVVAKKWGF